MATTHALNQRRATEAPNLEVPKVPDTPDGPAIDINRSLPLLALLMAGSGCAALIYEIVWLQLLQLVIGSSAVSLAVLLGTWMGGMCLGSLLFARFVTPGRSALKVYAALEAGTAVFGILVLFVLPLVEKL